MSRFVYKGKSKDQAWEHNPFVLTKIRHLTEKAKIEYGDRLATIKGTK